MIYRIIGCISQATSRHQIIGSSIDNPSRTISVWLISDIIISPIYYGRDGWPSFKSWENPLVLDKLDWTPVEGLGLDSIPFKTSMNFVLDLSRNLFRQKLNFILGPLYLTFANVCLEFVPHEIVSPDTSKYSQIVWFQSSSPIDMSEHVECVEISLSSSIFSSG